MDSIEFIVFCKYYKSFPHKAIFIPSLSVSDHISFQELLALFQSDEIPIIEQLYNKHEDGLGYYVTGFKINNRIIQSSLIDHWSSMIEYGPYPDDTLFYYIRDKNRYLSPIDLREKFLNMTSKEIFELTEGNMQPVTCTVKDCIIISEAHKDQSRPIMLRYFAIAKPKRIIDKQEIRDILESDPRIISALTSSNDFSIFSGFDFVVFADIEGYDAFCGKKFRKDDIILTFDES